MGLELQSLGRPAQSQPLYLLHYRGGNGTDLYSGDTLFESRQGSICPD
jgi:hypothetical protein